MLYTKTKIKVYFGRPFTNCLFEDVKKYYDKIKSLKFTNINPVIPLMGNENINKTIPANIIGNNPVFTDQSIMQRDKWLLKNSDVLFMDFSIKAEMPVGCFFELAWAYDWGLYTIVILPQNCNIDRTFVRACSHTIFTEMDDALNHLMSLQNNL